MKRKCLTLAFAAGAFAATGAHAQSSVQLYGLMDLSVPTYQSHANANGDHVIGMGIGGEPWFSGSRWGLRGAEDIGGGSKIIFRLESEYVVANGQMEDPGRIFDRDRSASKTTHSASSRQGFRTRSHAMRQQSTVTHTAARS